MGTISCILVQCNDQHIVQAEGRGILLTSPEMIMSPLQVQGPEALVPPDLEVAHIPYERGGPYPGVFLFSAPARMIRPVLQMESGARELIGTLEQIDLNIRCAHHRAIRLLLHVLQLPEKTGQYSA